MIPVLYRFPEWIPVVGDQAITSFGAFLLIAFIAAGVVFVRELRGRDTVAPAGDAFSGPSTRPSSRS